MAAVRLLLAQVSELLWTVCSNSIYISTNSSGVRRWKLPQPIAHSPQHTAAAPMGSGIWDLGSGIWDLGSGGSLDLRSYQAMIYPVYRRFFRYRYVIIQTKGSKFKLRTLSSPWCRAKHSVPSVAIELHSLTIDSPQEDVEDNRPFAAGIVRDPNRQQRRPQGTEQW